MILVCVALRFLNISNNSVVFFYIVLSVYLVAFVIGLALAEFKVEKVREYVNFLDTKFGRGSFIIFTALLILEGYVVQILIFIALCVIGVVNMLVGCKQGSDGKKALAMKAQENLKKQQKSQRGGSRSL